MKRRSFLKSILAAYCTPIAMELAPMLMRPIVVVEEAESLHLKFDYCETAFRYVWPDKEMWVKANPNLDPSVIRGCEWIEVAVAHRPLNRVAVDG